MAMLSTATSFHRCRSRKTEAAPNPAHPRLSYAPLRTDGPEAVRQVISTSCLGCYCPKFIAAMKASS